MEYIVCFVISILFMYFGEKKISLTGSGFNVYILLSALCPIVLAGIRDISIGIDVTWYVTPSYFAALSQSSLDSYLKYMAEDDLGFFIYVFIITKIFNNLCVLMTLNHLVIILPIIYVLYQFKKEYSCSMWFGYGIWLLYDYNMSLCIIRQSMSLSIAMLALLYLMKKKWIYVFIWGALAVSFHKTTFIFLLLSLFFYYISFKINSIRSQKVLVALILGAIFLGKIILSYTMPYLASKYSERLDSSESMSGGVYTILFLLLTSLYPFAKSIIKKKILYPQFIMYLPLIGFVLYIVSRNFGYLSRMAYPFNVMMIFTIPIVMKSKWLKIGMLSALLVFWIVSICIRVDWETYPYLISIDLMK